jgi:hypothetical protein
MSSVLCAVTVTNKRLSLDVSVVIPYTEFALLWTRPFNFMTYLRGICDWCNLVISSSDIVWGKWDVMVMVQVLR